MCSVCVCGVYGGLCMGVVCMCGVCGVYGCGMCGCVGYMYVM